MTYKVVFRSTIDGESASRTLWEPGCPLVVKAVQVSRDTETGEAFLQVRIKNISDSLVGSFEAEIEASFGDGLTRIYKLCPLDADIAQGLEYVPAPIKLDNGNVLSASVKMLTVSSSGKKWVSSTTAQPAPTPSPIVMSNEALAERSALLADGGFPSAVRNNNALHMENGWWLCPCGQPNVNRGSCCKCGASLLDLKNLSSISEPELIERAAARKARFDAEQRATMEKRKEDAAKRKKVTMIAAIVIAVIVAVFINVQVVVPSVNKAIKSTYRASRGAPTFEGIKVGDNVSMGGYEQDNDEGNGKEPIEWSVIDEKDGKLLLISNQGLDVHAFNDAESKGNQWSTSDLRSWMNDEFMLDAFSPGETDVFDGELFCLSENQAEAYFKDSWSRICTPTEYALSRGAKKNWWLSTEGASKEEATCVDERGVINHGVKVTTATTTIRPAVWVEQ